MKGRDYKAKIPGYCSWHFARNTRNNKTKRNAVGFPVLVRETLRKYFTVHQASENIVCMDIKSRHNGIFHVGFVYITPMGSTFYRKNFICPFDEIQDEITQKRAMRSVIISGDWNARTWNLNEIKSAGHFMESDYMKRNNYDQVVNTYGLRLVELCKNNNMIIVNGRVTSEQGVIENPFTCIKYNGVRTVDYAVADYCALKCGIFEPPVLGKNDILGFNFWDWEKGYLQTFPGLSRNAWLISQLLMPHCRPCC